MVVLAGDERRGKVLQDFFKDRGIPALVYQELKKLPAQGACAIAVGAVSAGYEYPGLKLAVLFLSGADIWLLDEPGANLDTAGKTMVLQAARKAADAGKLVLLATNDSGEEAAADDTICL